MTLTDPEDPPPNEIPTSPVGSAPPSFPPHDSLPAGMLGERPTDKAPIDPDEIRSLLTDFLTEQNTLSAIVFERLGIVVETQEAIKTEQARQARVHEMFAIHIDARLDDIKEAAIEAGNGGLAVSAAIAELRDGLEQQIKHEVAKALDAHLPIERLAAAER